MKIGKILYLVGCIYKHPNMPITEFISDFLEPLLTKISFEKKEVILPGDYNINLLHCESDKNTCDFLELMLSFFIYAKNNESNQDNSPFSNPD